MKLIIPFLFLTSTLTIQAQSNIDVLHYKYEIELNDQNDSIMGKALITFIKNDHSPIITLDLANINKDKKGMLVTYTVVGNTITPIADLQHRHQKLIFSNITDIKKDDTATITIHYKGIPADGLIISKTKYGKRSFFADNWPNRGHNWLPCNDDPADKASVEFIITAPQHYQVVSNGIQLEESNLPTNKKRTHWKEDVPISTKVMTIGVADFAVNFSGSVDNCIPVYSWVYPEDRENGFFDFSQAIEILPWFINNIGPYAYKKLANVQSKTTFGGLENANTIFYSENSINGTRISESLLVHEIAHQWFGNYATEKSFAHLWLSEGFATYMTILYMENKYGKDTATALLEEDRQQALDFEKGNRLPVVNNTQNYLQLLNPNSYQKGGWVLHMLRQQLGDSIFFMSIKKYYSTYGGKTADSKDFQEIVESVSGKKLEQFFQQWLYYPVNPKLKITWKYDPGTKNILVTIDQLQEGPAFHLPLEIGINSGIAKTTIQTLNLYNKKESFILPSTNKPINLFTDPNVSLLIEETTIEIK